jgi:hypothetical protein
MASSLKVIRDHVEKNSEQQIKIKDTTSKINTKPNQLNLNGIISPSSIMTNKLEGSFANLYKLFDNVMKNSTIIRFGINEKIVTWLKKLKFFYRRNF